MGDISAPATSARDLRRAPNAGDSAASSRAAKPKDSGPGGRTRMSGAFWPGSELGKAGSLSDMGAFVASKSVASSYVSGVVALARLGRDSEHAVSPCSLRFEKTLVGALHQIGRALVRLFQHGDTDADRHPDLVVLKNEAVLLDLLANALGERRGPGQISLRQNDGELLAAIAREDLVAANAALHHPRQLLQDEVAGQVAVDVVDFLEMVEVEHEKAELSRVTARTEDLALEGLVQVPLVVHLRETIDDGHAIDLFVVLALDVGA